VIARLPAAIIFLPFVLACQAWSYYVSRRRVSQQEFLLPPAWSEGGSAAARSDR